MTSIQLPVPVRDRLATAANARGMTVRALLDELSRTAADEALMDQAATQMRALRDTDPQEWSNYLADGASWEQGTVEQFDS